MSGSDDELSAHLLGDEGGGSSERRKALHETNNVDTSPTSPRARLELEYLYDARQSPEDSVIRRPSSSTMLLCPPGSNDTQSGSRRRARRGRMRKCRECCSLKNICFYVSSFLTLGLLGVIPYLAVFSAQHGSVTWTSFCIAGFFVVLTIPISLIEIGLHLTHWYAPDVQKYVVRILWMVPLYSLTSWSSLLLPGASDYTDPLRDLYEAYVISSFVYYMIALLGGEDALSELLERKDPALGFHPYPLRLIGYPQWQMGEEFMNHCKWGTLQFIVVKTISTLAYVILRPLGWYTEGNFSPFNVFTYVSLLLSSSMGYAMYCLIKLFIATNAELRSPKDWHPVGKFLCIKGVVFFTFWQGLLLMVLRNAGLIGPIGSWNAKNVAEGLQNLIVCVEMLCFAIAHHFTFTYKDYMSDNRNSTGDDTDGRGGNASLASPLLRRNGKSQENTDTPNIDDSIDGASMTSVGNIRRLSQPMSVRRALWSSAVPHETLNDISTFTWGDRDAVDQNDVRRNRRWGRIFYKSAEHV